MENDLSFIITGVRKAPIHLVDDHLFLFILADWPIYEQPANGHPLELKYNLSTEKADIFFRFPELYEGFYGLYHTHPCRILAKDLLVYSFPITPTIYSVNINNGITQHKPNLRSPHLDHDFEVIDDFNQQTYQRYAIENGIYYEILFDPFRELYYRFVLHPIPHIDPATGKKRSYIEQKPFSIQILDTDLNLLGETEFPAGTYYQTNFFVAPEGLYISNNNDFNPEAREDYLSFTLLKVID